MEMLVSTVTNDLRTSLPPAVSGPAARSEREGLRAEERRANSPADTPAITQVASKLADPSARRHSCNRPRARVPAGQVDDGGGALQRQYQR
jgi:hypothetical protein